MSDLVKRSIDRDLIVLDEITDDCSIPERDWESIINVYNQNNSPFPIPASKCSKIIQAVKDGRIPKMVFQQYGISYPNFRNKYNKTKAILEELGSKNVLTDEEWQIVQSLRSYPVFMLGQDIERASAHHFNQATDYLQIHSKANAALWLAYMKEIHKEEFTEKEDKKSIEVVIQFGPEILNSI